MHPTNSPTDLVRWEAVLDSFGVSRSCGSRWIKRGWLKPTTNISGRNYVERAAVKEFERRARAGEFAINEHKGLR